MPYRPCERSRLWQPLSQVVARWRVLLARPAGWTVLLAVAFASSGCAVPLGSLGGHDDDAAKAATGALGRRSARDAAAPAGEAGGQPQDTAALPGEADLAFARLAIAEALGKSGTTRSTPWENPATGARGTITPLTAAYRQDGRTCRDFLASHVHEGRETWLEGGACRLGPGHWEVTRLEAWKRA